MRRDAASIRIQKHVRAHSARKAYLQVYESATAIQTGLRAMAARNEHRFRRETRASIIIQLSRFALLCLSLFANGFSRKNIMNSSLNQTRWRQHRAYAAYKQQQKASLILQCLWRARIARKELRKLRMVCSTIMHLQHKHTIHC